eukprot:232180_1
MEQLIYCRQSAEDLSDTEYQQLLQLIGRTTLMHIVFHGLQHEIHHHKMLHIEEMNRTIQTIKESRPVKERSNSHQKTNSLDGLPYVMLSNISSFLLYPDKIHFERANRSTFIGVRSNTIPTYTLSTGYFSKLVKFSERMDLEWLRKLNVFKSVQMDCFGITTFNQLQLFDHIETLDIRNSGLSPIEFLFTHLLTKTTLPNLKTLKYTINNGDIFQKWGHRSDPFAWQRFKNYANLKYIQVTSSIAMLDALPPSDDYTWLSSLEGIAIHVSRGAIAKRVMNDVYKSLTNKLESLHQNSCEMTDAMDGKFTSLKEICLSWNHPTEKSIQMLSKQNMKRLKRVHFRNIGGMHFAKEPMKMLMNKIVQNVAYIGLHFNLDPLAQVAEMGPTLVALVLLINAIKYTKKHKLKIRIHGMILGMLTWEGMESLINILNEKCLHWMLIGFGCYVDGYGKIKASIDDLCTDYTIRMQNCHSEKMTIRPMINFIVSNKECDINGYQEQWIMPCDFCQQHTLFD